MSRNPSPPLPPDWQEERSSSGEVYYRNRVTGEATFRRPAVLTALERQRQVEKCTSAAAEWLLSEAHMEPSTVDDLSEFLVEMWQNSTGPESFAAAVGTDSGISQAGLTDLYHLVHAGHPVKRRDFLASREYRERKFDSNPPEGWAVRESGSTLGAFYYLNTSTGETSVERPKHKAASILPSPAGAAPSPPRGDVFSVAEVDVKHDEDTLPPFLSGGCGAFRPAAVLGPVLGQPDQSSVLVKNPGGLLAKAASHPSELLEARRKAGIRTTNRWVMPGRTGSSTRRPPGALLSAQLPIHAHRPGILKAVAENPCLVVIGETGSGKTTQIPQYLVGPGGCCNGGIVACTQPRRVSAITIARRVAQERGVQLGEEVGYSVRFDEKAGKDTTIKYMTDGMLLREMLSNPQLSRYSAVMIDEAHERTLTTDLLLYLLKQLLLRKTPLKLIVSSATIEAGKFSKYFLDSPVYYIPGRSHPVETLYLHEREDDWYAMALKVVFEIHVNEGAGDILVFLTGQDEIDAACQICYEWYQQLVNNHPSGAPKPSPMTILPLYSSLPSGNQSEVFEPAPPGTRKVIFATNIAETSVTIDGIVFVVDCGFAKTKIYDPSHKMDALVVCPISQAAARQRAGRAGRTGPGKCFRLYTEDSFDLDMHLQNIPEAQRSNLESTILVLKKHEAAWQDMNKDKEETEEARQQRRRTPTAQMMDPPTQPLVSTALFHLYHLGALDDFGALTGLGTSLLRFPLEPYLAKMLLVSVSLGCPAEMCAVVSMLSCGSSVFYRDGNREKFSRTSGDHATYLEVFSRSYGLQQMELAEWCSDNGVNIRSIEPSHQIAEQLLHILRRCADEDRTEVPDFDPDRSNEKVLAVQEAVAAGSTQRVARKFSTESGLTTYKTLGDGLVVAIHPSSVFYRLSFEDSPEWIAFNELVQTKREYVRDVTIIEPSWLVKHAPSFFHSTSIEYRGRAAEVMRREVASIRSSMGGSASNFRRRRNDEMDANDSEEDTRHDHKRVRRVVSGKRDKRRR